MIKRSTLFFVVCRPNAAFSRFRTSRAEMFIVPSKQFFQPSTLILLTALRTLQKTAEADNMISGCSNDNRRHGPCIHTQSYEGFYLPKEQQ